MPANLPSSHMELFLKKRFIGFWNEGWKNFVEASHAGLLLTFASDLITILPNSKYFFCIDLLPNTIVN